MCGIIGYIGSPKSVRDTIIQGLKILEYRGYDSSGVCFLYNSKFNTYKSVGKIKDLENTNSFEQLSSLAIGHTRWATHGEVNENNTHPHFSKNKRILLVHNGVINNYLEIKGYLESKGYKFYSDTDSEVIANLLEDLLLENEMLNALNILKSKLEGSYALVIIDNNDKDHLYFIKHLTPLLICKCNDSNFLVSDINAGSYFSTKFISIEDNQYGYVSKDKVLIYQDNKEVVPKEFESQVSQNDISMGGFPHYMIKEIYEQPSILGKICNTYISDSNELINFDSQVLLQIKEALKIYIVACGTSYHAGLIGKQVFEKILKKSTDVLIASEFDVSNMFIENNAFFIFISQSGETYDVKMALKQIKGKYNNLLLTNVVSSSLGRECDSVVNILAGPEIAVASTKAYSAQVAILLLILYALTNKLAEYKKEIIEVCSSIQETLIRSHHILSLVKDNLIDKEHCFYIGKSLDYYIAQEASLKLKEISYIHSEAFAAGELKHGTIALIEKDTPVIGIISQANVANNLRSSLEEVSSRKAKIIVISTSSLSRDSDDFVVREVSANMLSLAIIPVFQLMAYYAALLRYKDIDKPRNLAKSVTVE